MPGARPKRVECPVFFVNYTISMSRRAARFCVELVRGSSSMRFRHGLLFEGTENVVMDMPLLEKPEANCLWHLKTSGLVPSVHPEESEIMS